MTGGHFEREAEPVVGHELATARRIEGGNDPGQGALGSEPPRQPPGVPAPGVVEQLRPGMEVRGSDTNRIGWIKTVRGRDAHVSRQLARDLYIPLDAFQAVVQDCAYLAVPQSEVDAQDWPGPPILG